MILPLLLICLAEPEREVAPAPRHLTQEMVKIAPILQRNKAYMMQIGLDRLAQSYYPTVIAKDQRYFHDLLLNMERWNAWILANPTDPSVVDAFVVLSQSFSVDDATFNILRNHHFAHPRLGLVVRDYAQSGETQRQFAYDVAINHASREVRAQACLDIGQMNRIYLTDAVSEKPSFRGRLGTPDVLRKRATNFLTRCVKDYPAVKNKDGELIGELATDELAGVQNIGCLELGKLAPDISGTDLQWRQMTVTAKSGRVTVLVFWGTWCGPCMRLVPREIALNEKYKNRAFALIGVNGGDERQKAQQAAVAKK